MTEFSPIALEQLQELFRRFDALERAQKPLSSQASATRQPQSQQIMLGKPTILLGAGQTGDFEIWSSAVPGPDRENPTGEFIRDVLNRAFDVTIDDLCYLMFIDGGVESSKAVC